MTGRLVVENQVMFLDCPAYLGGDRAVRCGLPAEVEELYSVSSTDGRLESARIRCPCGHWFNGHLELLAVPEHRSGLRYQPTHGP